MKIFYHNLKNSKKIIPFNTQKNEQGNIKYFPSYFKEWKNTIYSFNPYFMKNIPFYNENINAIIKGYFHLFIKNYNLIFNINFTYNYLYKLKKIFISKPEIKYTNNKAIINIFVVNLQQSMLRKQYLTIYKKITTFFIGYYTKSYEKKFSSLYYCINMLQNQSFEHHFESNTLQDKKYNKKEFLIYKVKFLNTFSHLRKLYTRKFWLIFYKKYINSYVTLLKQYNIAYASHYNKFNKYSFLALLSSILSKIVQKNIEYNIIRLKSFTFHPDIFTQVFSLKIKDVRKHHYTNLMQLLSKVSLPNLNKFEKKAIITNYDEFTNKHKDLTIINNLNEGHLVLSNNINIHENIFHSIKYKYLKGIRLEVKGRLTKRYRADRAISCLQKKGGLKNIDSSFKGSSEMLFRGNTNSNILYSMSKSKRRIGAFAVKGWIAG